MIQKEILHITEINEDAEWRGLCEGKDIEKNFGFADCRFDDTICRNKRQSFRESYFSLLEQTGYWD